MGKKQHHRYVPRQTITRLQRFHLLSQYISIICILVSNIEAIQSQLKNIYTNTLSTLCPLPWLEKSEDVQYKFDDVFIPLCTTNIDIQQHTGNFPGPSGSSSRSAGAMGNHHSVRYKCKRFIKISKIMKYGYKLRLLHPPHTTKKGINGGFNQL